MMNRYASPLMSNRADFDNESRLVEFLASQLRQGRIALFLGAGISKPFGLPLWDQLLQRLFASRQRKPNRKDKLEKQAEAFHSEFFATDHSGYVKAIHDALYDRSVRVDFEEMRRNATLAAIASLVMSSRRGRVAHVVTFNFDNLLEIYLQYHGFVVRSIAEDNAWAGVADVAVLHPHGLIPYGAPDKSSSQIVFDRSSYATVIGDAKNAWRQQILCILRSHTCLFIGLSGDDDNLLSMLMDCKGHHASDANNSAFWGATFTTASTDQADIWEKNGVFRKRVKDYEIDLPRILFAISQDAASAETSAPLSGLSKRSSGPRLPVKKP
jgi:hypothetical protein